MLSETVYLTRQKLEVEHDFINSKKKKSKNK